MQLRTAQHRHPQESALDSTGEGQEVPTGLFLLSDGPQIRVAFPSHTHPHQVDGHWRLSSADLAGKEGQEVILLPQLHLGPACISPAALMPRKDRAAPHCNTHQSRVSAPVLVLLPLLCESCSVACSPPCSGQVSGKSGPHTGNLDPVISPHSSVSSSER